jgi:peroxiredoxin family protein
MHAAAGGGEHPPRAVRADQARDGEPRLHRVADQPVLQHERYAPHAEQLRRLPRLCRARAAGAAAAAPPITKVSIVVSKGSLEGIYPALIMANGARMEGIEANVFFTFFGMDAVTNGRDGHVKVATVGNPGLHLPTLLGGLPGVSTLVTLMMERKMEKLDIPPIPEFVQMLADSGARLFACKASVEMFGLTEDDFVPAVEGVITVGEFYALAAGGQIIFT